MKLLMEARVPHHQAMVSVLKGLIIAGVLSSVAVAAGVVVQSPEEPQAESGGYKVPSNSRPWTVYQSSYRGEAAPLPIGGYPLEYLPYSMPAFAVAPYTPRLGGRPSVNWHKPTPIDPIAGPVSSPNPSYVSRSGSGAGGSSSASEAGRDEDIVYRVTPNPDDPNYPYYPPYWPGPYGPGPYGPSDPSGPGGSGDPTSPVPVPGAIWLLAAGLGGLAGVGRLRR